jgi:hypothetical protein
MKKYFKVQKGEYDGSNWCLCFGTSLVDDKKYSITTNNINASNLHNLVVDAKDDADLVCKLLNLYFNGKIKIK